MKHRIKRLLGGVGLFSLVVVTVFSTNIFVNALSDQWKKSIEGLAKDDLVKVEWTEPNGDKKEEVVTVEEFQKNYEASKYTDENCGAKGELLSVKPQKKTGESAVAGGAPKNIEVKFIKTEEGASGKKYLIGEVSWDDDGSATTYWEEYPLLLDKDGNAYLIPGTNGQTIGSANDVPESQMVTIANGRVKRTFRLSVLKDDENQIKTDEKGTFATGVREGDSIVYGVTAVIDPTTWRESEMGQSAEVKFTTENVESQKVFK